MRFSTVTLFSLAALATSSFASDVIDLTKDTFSNIINKEKLILVEFFAPWCGHCKALAPEYEKAATTLKDESIALAKVDCTVESDLCQQHEVQGYPTLKIFREGTPSEYKGARQADAIVSIMKKQALPPLSEVTAKNLEQFSQSDKIVIVGFFSSSDSEEYKIFEKIANQYRDDYVFGATVDSEAISKHKIKTPGFILFKKFDEGQNTFTGKFNAEEITSFIKTHSVPLMAEIGPDNYGTYVESGLPLAYLFVSNDEERQNIGVKFVEPVAKDYKGKVNFVYIDAVKYGAHGKNLNLEDKWPAFVIQEAESGLKFPYPQDKEITGEGMKQFVSDYVAKKLKPSLKSEPVPESNDGPVKIVVGSTYQDIVLDKEKDVFIELYAPWCGHCKRLAPIWDELGEKYKNVDKVVIAKMDATENDVPPGTPFKIEGFPTLKFYKAGKEKEILDYNGDRSLEALVEYIEETATNKGHVKVEKEEESSTEEGHDEL